MPTQFETLWKMRTRPIVNGAGCGLAMLWMVGGCVEIRVPDPLVSHVAFGDSTTKGPSTRDYPDILRELLGAAPERFANEGRGGETTEEGLTRLKSLLASGVFPEAAILMYWEGGNDLTDFIQEHDPFLLFSLSDPDYPFAAALSHWLDAVQGNVEEAILAAQEARLKVFVATYFLLREEVGICDPLPLDVLLPAQARRANEYVLALNERIRLATAHRGALLVDVGASAGVLAADPANYFNCNHLSEQGNTIVANIFLDVLPPPGP